MKTFALCLLATAASAVKINTKQDDCEFCDPLYTAAKQVMEQYADWDGDSMIGSESELDMIKQAIAGLAEHHGENVTDEEIQQYLADMAGEDGAIDTEELAWIMGDLLWATDSLGDFYVGAGILEECDWDGSGSVCEDEFIDGLTDLAETVMILGGADGVDADEVDALIDTFYIFEQDGAVISEDLWDAADYLYEVGDAVDELAGGILLEDEMWEGVIGLTIADRDMDGDVDMNDILAIADLGYTIAEAYDIDEDDEINYAEMFVAAVDGEIDIAGDDWLYEMWDETEGTEQQQQQQLAQVNRSKKAVATTDLSGN